MLCLAVSTRGTHHMLEFVKEVYYQGNNRNAYDQESQEQCYVDRVTHTVRTIAAIRSRVQKSVLSGEKLESTVHMHGFSSDSGQACLSIYQILMFIARVQNLAPGKWTASANWNWRVGQLISEKLPNVHVLDQFSNNANGEAHIRWTGPEIWKDIAGKVDIFVVASGSRGTVFGVWNLSEDAKPSCQNHLCWVNLAACLKIVSRKESKGKMIATMEQDDDAAVIGFFIGLGASRISSGGECHGLGRFSGWAVDRLEAAQEVTPGPLQKRTQATERGHGSTEHEALVYLCLFFFHPPIPCSLCLILLL
jgi:hypothetical protein